MSLILIGLKGCGYTMKAISLLNNHNIQFKELYINDDNTENQLNTITGSCINKDKLNNYNTYPRIFFINENNNIFIGGFSDLDYLFYIIKDHLNKLYDKNAISSFINAIKKVNNNTGKLILFIISHLKYIN